MDADVDVSEVVEGDGVEADGDTVDGGSDMFEETVWSISVYYDIHT